MQQQQLSASVVVGAPQPAPYYVQPHVQPYTRPPVTNFLGIQALGLGIIQILIGGLYIIFNGVALGLAEIVSTEAHGIWCAVIVSIDVQRQLVNIS